ncbi:hypothetical protein [Escherichia coli]
MHKSTLQNLKLYLALDSDGHYVISKEMKTLLMLSGSVSPALAL